MDSSRPVLRSAIINAMGIDKRLVGSCVAVAVLGGLLTRAQPGGDAALQRHRNLGKAFYENPTTHAEAVAEFKKALDLAPQSATDQLNYALAMLRGGRDEEAVKLLEQVQRRDPALPHTWFNLGMAYKKQGRADAAAAQFERLIKIAPGEPIGHYQLGAIYRSDGRDADATAQFEEAARLNPLLAAAHFQLYNLYRRAGKTENAAKQLAEFQRLKQQAEHAAVPEDPEWCNFAEIYDPPRAPVADVARPKPTYEDHVLDGATEATGLLAIDAGGSGESDLVVWSPHGVQLFRHGTTLVRDSGLASISGVISVAAGDFDNDGLMDLLVLTEMGPALYRNQGGRFAKVEAALPARRFERAVWLDYDHDYDLDLLLLDDAPALLRNQGAAGFSDHTADFPFVHGHATAAVKLRVDPDSKAFDLAVFYRDREPVLYRDQLGGRYLTAPFQGTPPDATKVSADFDGDGRMDEASIDSSGRVHVKLNRTRAASRWIRVGLKGVKSLKLAQDAEVEVKAGLFYERRHYNGLPLLFETGGNATVDTVRITWPNGLIQNETNQPAGHSYTYTEAQRLSGSCPMIWTWNGREFQFITDVLGVAPLGASDGEGSYFPVDHDEYVSIPAKAMRARDGKYEVRVTEELSEVSYLDQVQLMALDHPAQIEVFTNEKFKSPPYPEFRLYQAPRRIYPRVARDDLGRDVLPLLMARDQRYPDQFPRTPSGAAARHTLDLDFSGAAPAGDAVLLLNGWVDWPDGSTFRAISQERPGGFTMPQLWMQDAAGTWVRAIEDMGMPAGKPKTIAVPLHFISSRRAVRIVTDLCVYWDEIFL